MANSILIPNTKKERTGYFCCFGRTSYHEHSQSSAKHSGCCCYCSCLVPFPSLTTRCKQFGSFLTNIRRLKMCVCVCVFVKFNKSWLLWNLLCYCFHSSTWSTFYIFFYGCCWCCFFGKFFNIIIISLIQMENCCIIVVTLAYCIFVS